MPQTFFQFPLIRENTFNPFDSGLNRSQWYEVKRITSIYVFERNSGARFGGYSLLLQIVSLNYHFQ